MTKSKERQRRRAKTLTIERTVKAPLEKVWAMWTTKDGFESWWGPEGFTTSVRKLDLRPGGRFEYVMTATGPAQVEAMKAADLAFSSTARGTYTEIAPRRRLAYKTLVDFIPGIAPYEVGTVVEFHAVPQGVRIVVIEDAMHDEQWTQMSVMGMTSSLDKLARILGGLTMSRENKHPMKLTLPTDREIVITRVFRAPRERVFTAFTSPRAIPEWLGPRNLTTKVDKMDVRPGGEWRFVQWEPDGKEHAFRGVYREVVPPVRVVRTFEYEGMAGHVLLETVTFEALRSGKTKVTVRSLFETTEDRDGMLKAGAEWGMREGMERLEELLARGT